MKMEIISITGNALPQTHTINITGVQKFSMTESETNTAVYIPDAYIE